MKERNIKDIVEGLLRRTKEGQINWRATGSEWDEDPTDFTVDFADYSVNIRGHRDGRAELMLFGRTGNVLLATAGGTLGIDDDLLTELADAIRRDVYGDVDEALENLRQALAAGKPIGWGDAPDDDVW